MATLPDLLAALEQAPRFRFADWPNLQVPQVAAGVYAVWRDTTELVYVGMSGRGLSAEAIATHRTALAKGKGLFSRLASHAAGRRSGDQFCVYVADRLVLPTLTPEAIQGIAAGTVSLDRLVREFVHEHLAYSYVEVGDGEAALALELAARRGGMWVGAPKLNPGKTPWSASQGAGL